MEFKIIEKAWSVIDPTVYEESVNYDDGEIVFAETITEAKRKCRDYSTFINIRAKRKKDCDVVEYNGEQMKRWQVAEVIRREERNKKLLNLPENELFYVQDMRSYVGNSILWWGLNNNGYTTDIKKAQKYTKAEILKKFTNGRETDIIWVARHVEENVKTHVDSQYLDGVYAY